MPPQERWPIPGSRAGALSAGCPWGRDKGGPGSPLGQWGHCSGEEDPVSRQQLGEVRARCPDKGLPPGRKRSLKPAVELSKADGT